MGEPQGVGAAAARREESPAERADVILTPDQRVRVFVSSTLGELATERAAARRAITRMHLVPVWYESGARPHPPRSMYQAYLAQSQVFVGIYWQRYGWVAPGMDISGLEDEYRLAVGKPMLLYLAWRRPGRPSGGGPATPATTPAFCGRSATTPTTLRRGCSGRCGFAPAEVWNSYPLLLPGEAALALPGAARHPGYPLALAVSALFASIRVDVTGTDELWRRAAEANARQATPDWRVEETICAARQNIALATGAFADAARLAEQAAGHARVGGDLADASLHFGIAVGDHMLAGDTPSAVPLAREALALARQTGAPALVATGLLAVGLAVAET